jgi:hypothetical protein
VTTFLCADNLSFHQFVVFPVRSSDKVNLVDVPG